MSAHSGPVVIRTYPKHISVLCPLGHLVTAHRTDDGTFGGSWFEAAVSAHQSGLRPWVVECGGTVPS